MPNASIKYRAGGQWERPMLLRHGIQSVRYSAPFSTASSSMRYGLTLLVLEYFFAIIPGSPRKRRRPHAGVRANERGETRIVNHLNINRKLPNNIAGNDTGYE